MKASSSFDFLPSLEGKKLALRPLKADDFENLYKAASDPLIWEQHPDRKRHERATFENFFKGALESKGTLVALEKISGEIIGSSRFLRWTPEPKSVEIGFTFLARRFWGKGFNQEMKKLMLAHAFRFADAVWFYIGTENLRSRKAVEKLGARFQEELDWPPGRALHKAAAYRLDRP